MIRRAFRTVALLAALAAPPASAITAGALMLAGSSAPARAATSVDISIFYDSLSPYGHWFSYGSYGYAWTPYDMPYGWRPYTHGHWIYSDCGWTWVSDYRWGWAPFHYGRWIFDPDYGWIWIPGRDWGPAWVVWRWSDDWVGWAPLPPSAVWTAGVGMRFGDGRTRWEPDEHCWSFTRPQWLLDPGVRYKFEPMGRNVTLMRSTRTVADYDIVGGRPRDRGRDVKEFEKLIRRQVPRYRVVDERSPAQAERVGLRNEARMFRPDVRPAPDKRPIVRQAGSPGPSPQVIEVRRQQERRKVDTYYRQEESKLKAEQGRELRRPAPPSRAELDQRHADENRALQDQKVREERVRDQRIEKRIEKPGRATAPGQARKQGDKKN